MQFLEGVVDVAIVVLLGIILFSLRDIRDALKIIIAQKRLEQKRREWVRQEHDDQH